AGELAFVFAGEHLEDDAPLLEVVLTGCPVGGFSRPGERRQQYGGQDADDGDDHQQFNQGEASVRPFLRHGGSSSTVKSTPFQPHSRSRAGLLVPVTSSHPPLPLARLSGIRIPPTLPHPTG